MYDYEIDGEPTSGTLDQLATTLTIPATGPFFSRAAQDATEGNFDRSYADYIERHSLQLYVRFAERGDMDTARLMLTRTLGEALAGNDGD